MRYEKIKIKSTSLPTEIGLFMKPQIVYIPLVSGGDQDITLLVNKGDYVRKGNVVGRRKGEYQLPLFSTVSGTVCGLEEKRIYGGKKVKCLVIQNDFKEFTNCPVVCKERIDTYTKEEFIQLLKDMGICGLGGEEMPTYLKYQRPHPKRLIVNAVDCEPEIASDTILFLNHCEAILETVDAILKMNKLEEAFIVVDPKNKPLIRLIQSFIGTYYQIHLCYINQGYPVGCETLLLSQLKQLLPNKSFHQSEIIINNVSTIFAIYQALKYQKPLLERLITLTGDMVKYPQTVWVKVGTPIDEVITSIGGLKRGKEVIMVAGGPMRGVSLPDHELITTLQLNGVYLKASYGSKVVHNCIRCGKCIQACPVSLSPMLIQKYHNSLLYKSQLQVDRCIGCGLCSYVCPAHLPLRETIESLKQKKEGNCYETV